MNFHLILAPLLLAGITAHLFPNWRESVFVRGSAKWAVDNTGILAVDMSKTILPWPEKKRLLIDTTISIPALRTMKRYYKLAIRVHLYAKPSRKATLMLRKTGRILRRIQKRVFPELKYFH